MGRRLEEGEGGGDLITVATKSSAQLATLVTGQNDTHKSIRELSATTHELLEDLGTLMGGVSTSNDIKGLKAVMDEAVNNSASIDGKLSSLQPLIEGVAKTSDVTKLSGKLDTIITGAEGTSNVIASIKSVTDAINSNVQRVYFAVDPLSSSLETIDDKLNGITASNQKLDEVVNELKNISELLGATLGSMIVSVKELNQRVDSVSADVKKLGDEVVDLAQNVNSVRESSDEAHNRIERIKSWYRRWGRMICYTYNAPDGWNWISTEDLDHHYYFGNYGYDKTLNSRIFQAEGEREKW